MEIILIISLTITIYLQIKAECAYRNLTAATDVVSEYLKRNISEISLYDIHLLYNVAMYDFSYYLTHPFYFGSGIKPEYRERLGLTDGNTK